MNLKLAHLEPVTLLVAVVQLAEHLVVAQGVVGSSPTSHPVQ